jgi:hypothetical protein
MLTSGAKTHRVCATSLAALLLLSYIFAVVAARAVEEDTGVGPPPALAPEHRDDRGLGLADRRQQKTPFSFEYSVSGKWLGLLKELAPGLAWVA